MALRRRPYLPVVERQMAYIASHRVVDVHQVDTDIVAEVRVGQLGVGIQRVAERVQPIGRCRGVTPRHIHQVVNPHVVTTAEEGQTEHILRRQTEVQAQVSVVEVHRVVLVVLARLQENVKIRTATGKEERRLVALYRPFGHHFGRQKSDSTAKMIALHIAGAGVNIKDRRRAAA